MTMCLTGVSSTSSEAAGGRRKVAQASHVPVTDSKCLTWLIFYKPMFHLNRLHSHTRQMQATTPASGTTGQQRAPGGRRDDNKRW
jgi:hypothetical protein